LVAGTPATGRADAPIIICYDGSQPATEALATTASLLPGAQALVVTVWRPFAETMLAGWLGPTPTVVDAVEVDDRERSTAEDVAQDGARRASEAGLQAEPLAVRTTGEVWEAVEEVARDRGARLIACGRRGRTAMRSAIRTVGLGSVSNGLVHHASRPVLVVPSPKPGAAS
jgi:nucleotide-binding universal stress UspA family protein